MGAFVNDVLPEEAAKLLRAVAIDDVVDAAPQIGRPE